MANQILATSAGTINLSSDKKEEIFDRVTQNLDDVWPIFYEKNLIGLRNLDYYMGRQWTDEELIAHKRQYRKAYVFNETFSKVDHLIGTQTQTRMDAKVMPREKSDDQRVALINFIIKWYEQVNAIEYTETEVFTDATIRAAGASVIRWKDEEIQYGYPSIEPVPINELYWDTNSQKMDLSDARWMARVQYRTRRECKEMFPEHEGAIDKISETWASNNYGAHVQNVLDHRLAQSQRLSHKWNKDEDFMPLVEYYEWELKPTYIVADEVRDEKKEFEDPEDALSYYEGLIEGYTEGGEILVNPDASPRVAVVSVMERDYYQTIIVGDQVITHEEIETPFFPWDVCFSYFNKGDYWAFVDNLISPQDLVNRAFSQLDYQLGATVKGAVTVIPSLLYKGYSIETARNEWSKTSPFIPVLDHKAFSPIPAGRIQPELFTEVNFGIQRMTDYAGGRNVLGQQENAAESGRAVIARAEQGGVARLPLFDRLRFWRQNTTYKAIWYIKNYMSPGQILRIIGKDEDVQYVELDDGILQSMREMKLDVIVDEAMKSDTAQERYFLQLKELFATVQYPPEITMPLMLEYMPLPESKKQKIQSMLGFYTQYKQEQEDKQHQETLKEQAKDSYARMQMRQQLETSQQLDDQQKEVDKKTGSLKVKLDDIEKLRAELQNPNVTIEEKNKLYGKLNTAQELGQREAAQAPVS